MLSILEDLHILIQIFKIRKRSEIVILSRLVPSTWLPCMGQGWCPAGLDGDCDEATYAQEGIKDSLFTEGSFWGEQGRVPSRSKNGWREKE